MCGDVENNPGPDTPLFSKKLLTSLKNGTCTTSVTDLGHSLKNKHILQLIATKDENPATDWPGVVKWITVLIPSRSFVDKKGQCQIRDSLIKVNNKINKDKSKAGYEDDMNRWKETDYRLPTTQPPKAKDSTKSGTVSPLSTFDVSVHKAEMDKLGMENEKLSKENEHLKKQVEVLRMRPSPHKQGLTKRRESDHLNKIFSEREQVRSLEKETC